MIADRLTAALAGIPVLETTQLRYDEMFNHATHSGLLVGERAHFLWRIQQVTLNNLCREQARGHIQTTASRILGEPWEVAST